MTTQTAHTTINFIDGEKGGTGKSWVARTLHHK
jgi:DNA-binding NtrC family response regulator